MKRRMTGAEGVGAEATGAEAKGGNRIWTSLPVPAFVIGADAVIHDVNPAAEGFLNVSSRSLIGVPLWQVLRADAALMLAAGRARDAGTPLFVNDVDIAVPPRPPMMCNLQLASLPGPRSEMIVLIAPRELAGQMGPGHGANAAAKSAIGMAEMLAHEIKNPLAGITGAAQLLGMNLGAEDRALTDLIVAECRRVVKLLEQVEQFGNLNPPCRGPVNLHDVLDRARRSALLGFGAAMQIIEEYDPSLPLAMGDADQLLQVVQNLLRNASEAAGAKGGVIRMRTYYAHSFRLRRADGGGAALPLQIEIIDNGPGLPDAIRDAVFDPFVSGRENGTGLGLALVSKIVSDLGGWISVTSVPGETCFRISLARAGQSDGDSKG